MPEPAIQAEMEVSPDLLCTFLNGRDVPCPNCNYNLRDLQGPLCPECGEKIVLRASLAEPKQGLLIAGLVGLSAGAGLNGLLLIYIAILSIRGIFHLDRQAWTFFGLTAGGLVVEGGATALWIFNWRRIRRLQFTSRLYLMLAAWVLTLIDIIVFSFSIR
jgi:hypothetical protein